MVSFFEWITKKKWDLSNFFVLGAIRKLQVQASRLRLLFRCASSASPSLATSRRLFCFTMLDLTLTGSDQPLLPVCYSLLFLLHCSSFCSFKKMSGSSTYPLHLVVLVLIKPRGGYSSKPLYRDSYSDPYRDWDSSYDRDPLGEWTGYERDPLLPTRVLFFSSHDTTTLDDVCPV